MTRDLLIMRHGHAQVQGSGRGGACDLSRKLTGGGKRDAQRVGAWMARSDMVPDHVICSPAERARNTAEKASKAAGLDGDRVCADARIYEASSEDLLGLLKASPASIQRLLLVGHNPGVTELVGLVDRTARRKRPPTMPPGALSYLRIEGDWCDLEAGGGDWRGAVMPEQLPRRFPFPSPDGAEQRLRPAYYYRQSSVIPYRQTDGELEILVIQSSGRKRWGVPKGVHDSGKSAQASAANEAFEEAGVLGEVGEGCLGVYEIQKWGATCEVSVFPMRVTRVLPEDEWPECHRGRQWLPLGQAEERVSNQSLKRLISRLPASLAAGAAERRT